MQKILNIIPKEIVEDYLQSINQMTRKETITSVAVLAFTIGALFLAGYIDSLPY